MPARSLEIQLRIAGALLVAAGLLELFVFQDRQPAPFVIGAALTALSFTRALSSPTVLRLLMAACVLLPLGAVVMYLRGRVMVGVPIFDAILFGWLWTRLRAHRNTAA